MNAFTDFPFVRQLTEAFAHVLWQGTAIGAVALGINCRLRQTASARYAVWLSALIGIAACLPVTLAIVITFENSTPDGASLVDRGNETGTSFKPTVPPQSGTDDGQPAERRRRSLGLPDRPRGAETVMETPERPADGDGEPQWTSIAPFVAGSYALGLFLMLTRLVLAIYGGQRLRRLAVPVEDGWQEEARRLAGRIGLCRTPVVAFCRNVAGPVVIGIVRPAILLPATLTTGLSPDQLRIVLLHELLHVRRYDPLVVMLQRLAEAVLFFHPVVWIVSRRLSVEREHCCDDAVLGYDGEAVTYAESLLQVARLSVHSLAADVANPAAVPAVGHRPSRLRQRIDRLLSRPTDSVDPAVRLTRGGLTTLLATVLVTLLAPALASSWADPAPRQSAGSSRQAVRNGQPSPSDGQPASGLNLAVQVVDSDSRALPAAKLRFVLPTSRLSANPKVLQGQCDNNGRFRLQLADVKGLPRTYLKQAVLWIEDGRPRFWVVPVGSELIQALSAGRSMTVTVPTESVEDRLTVLAPDSRPLAGAKVVPHRVIGPTPVPAELEPHLTKSTDDQGRIRLRRLHGHERDWSVRVTTVEFGSQIVSLPCRRKAEDHTVRLRKVGTVVGRIVCEDPKAARGIRLRLMTFDRQPKLDHNASSVFGWADVVSGDDGRFTVSAMAMGTTNVRVFLEPQSVFQARLPTRMQAARRFAVRAGETTRLDVPLEKAISVRGTVRIRGENKLLPGVELLLRGVGQQHVVLTDEDGRFHVFALPGARFQLDVRSVPPGFVPILPDVDGSRHVRIPQDAHKYDVRPLEILRGVERIGRVVGDRKQPIEGASVMALVDRRMVTITQEKSRKDGKFRLAIPRGVSNKARYLVTFADGITGWGRPIDELTFTIQALHDRQGIQGIWNLKTAVIGDKKKTAESVNKGRWIIARHQAWIERGQVSPAATFDYQIDSSQAPGRITLTRRRDNRQLQGIYRVEGDSLLLGINQSGGEAPARFPPKQAGDEVAFYTFERAPAWLNLPNVLSEQIVTALTEPTQFDFQRTRLSDVAQFISELHQVEVEVDGAALKHLGLTRNMSVNFQIDAVPLHVALRMMLNSMQLSYIVRDHDRIVITTKAAAEKARGTKPRARPQDDPKDENDAGKS